ncbi:nucleotidyltransferase family protein [Stenomitos frigidus]|uniref:Nucleotidyltransferase n=1 Tax=Stenomitos frigidus ULC18 TaxID=2107698 RepID=A0A2T1DVW7_9CYAN|nr:nucleotidyltransferase family protein [Stenomitos frigidus]PSB24653.1 nucleotidyltransferase [Stenomitos frigidus ULC18]
MSEGINSNDVVTKLRHLKPDLEKRYGVTRLGVFGSIARNEADHKSDIDIVVDMAPDLFKRVSLKAELELIFDKEVDVVRYWHGMNHYLKTRIDREAVYV